MKCTKQIIIPFSSSQLCFEHYVACACALDDLIHYNELHCFTLHTLFNFRKRSNRFHNIQRRLVPPKPEDVRVLGGLGVRL